MNSLAYVLILLLLVPGAFLPFLVSFLLPVRKAEASTRLAWSGVISFGVYLVIIVIPFFQGYADLYKNAGFRIDTLVPGEGYGLHHFLVFDTLAYFMTLGCSVCWLIAIVIQFAYGRFCNRKRLDLVFRSILLVFVSMCLWYDRIMTGVINTVLE